MNRDYHWSVRYHRDCSLIAAGLFHTLARTTAANDNFANAQVIAGASGLVNGSNVGATKETGESNHLGVSGGHSVWYRWKAPRNGPVAFSTYYSNFDTVLAVKTGTAVNHLTHIAGNDDINSSKTSWASFRAVAGTTYSIVVDGHGTAEGTIGLSWTQGGSDFDADGLSDLVTQNTSTLQVSLVYVVNSNVAGTLDLTTLDDPMPRQHITQFITVRLRVRYTIVFRTKKRRAGRCPRSSAWAPHRRRHATICRTCSRKPGGQRSIAGVRFRWVSSRGGEADNDLSDRYVRRASDRSELGGVRAHFVQ